MEHFMIALELMGKGMGGIFAALSLIAVFVWLMGKICK